MIPEGRDWLKGKLSRVLMGGAIPSKFLIQFSVNRLGCVPSLLFDLSNEGNCNLIQKVSCSPGPMPPPETPGHSWASLSQSPLGSLLLSPGSWYTQGFFVPSKSLFCQSCVYSGGSMVGLMETSSKRAYAIPRSAAPRAPCPWGSPVLTCTSIGDAQTLKGRSGSVSLGSPGSHKIMFEPSERLWWVWGLILNVISPLLPSGWGLSFALGWTGFW